MSQDPGYQTHVSEIPRTHFRSLEKMTSSNVVFSTFSRLVFANLHLNYFYQTQCIATTIFRLVDITFKQETPEPDSTLHQEQKLHFSRHCARWLLYSDTLKKKSLSYVCHIAAGHLLLTKPSPLLLENDEEAQMKRSSTSWKILWG